MRNFRFMKTSKEHIETFWQTSNMGCFWTVLESFIDLRCILKVLAKLRKESKSLKYTSLLSIRRFERLLVLNIFRWSVVAFRMLQNQNSWHYNVVKFRFAQMLRAVAKIDVIIAESWNIFVKCRSVSRTSFLFCSFQDWKNHVKMWKEQLKEEILTLSSHLRKVINSAI